MHRAMQEPQVSLQPLTSYVPSHIPFPVMSVPPSSFFHILTRTGLQSWKQFLQAQLSQECISRPFILCLLAHMRDGAGSAPLWLTARLLLPLLVPPGTGTQRGSQNPRREGWSALSCRKARPLTQRAPHGTAPAVRVGWGHSRPGWCGDLISFPSYLHLSTTSFLIMPLEDEACWS